MENALKESIAGLPVPQVRSFTEIGSTNDEAVQWAADGAPEGSLVIADSQTKGRGRFNRRWVTRPGVALAFSLLLRPTPAELPRLGLFSPLGALAICCALEEKLGLAPQIKWPNDVLLNRRKAAGILVESSWVGEAIQGIVIGIGINVAPDAVPPAEELLFPAISVEDVTQKPVDRFALLRDVLRHIFAWRARLHEEAFIEEWNRRLAFKDEWVEIKESGGGVVTGQVIRVDPQGNLLLRDASGTVRTIIVGDLHLRLMK